MKYGIICAMTSEINLLLKDITISNQTTIAHREFIEGNLYGKDVVLVKSGIGKVAAALTTTILIDRFHVDQIVFCGTAGGINKNLRVGDVVIGDYSVQHDIVVMGELFTVQTINVDYFPSNQALTKALYDAVTAFVEQELHNEIPQVHLDEFHITKPKVVIGTVASGDQFINDGSKNAWLEENVRNIQCVEMEGAAVAQVCYEFDVPFGIVRVISDSAGDDSQVDYEAFVQEAASHFTRGTMKAFLSK